MQPKKPLVKTQIKTSLPYCLYRLDTRFFKMEDKFNSKIRFIKVETTPNRRTQFSQNTEVIRDRWGIDAHSEVEILTDKKFVNSDRAKDFALNLINDFIGRYRFYDRGAVHLVPLGKEDLFELNLSLNGRSKVAVSFAGGMTIVNPLLNQEISSKIEQSLANKVEIPLWEEHILNAKQYLYQKEFRHAIIESVIALEWVLSEFIKEEFTKKGVPSQETGKYIYNLGLTGNIEITLRLLLNGIKNPDQKIFHECRTSIKLRNKIVHEGLKDITEQQAQNSLEYIKQLINFLNQ